MTNTTPTTSSSRTRARVVASVIAALCLATVAACSSSSPTPSNEASGLNTGGSGTSGTVREDTTTEAPDTTRRSTGTTGGTARSTTTTEGGGSSSSSITIPQINATPGNDEFCTKLAESVVQLANVDTNKLNDPNQLQEYLTQLQKTFQDLTDLAPDEIKADFSLLNQQVQKGGISSSQDTLPGSEAAEKRVETWVKDNCGYDLNELGS